MPAKKDAAIDMEVRLL